MGQLERRAPGTAYLLHDKRHGGGDDRAGGDAVTGEDQECVVNGGLVCLSRSCVPKGALC